MKFNELVSEINRMIAATPYSKAEIAAFWEHEDEENWKPEMLFALGAAYEYLHKRGNFKEAENIRGRYERRLHDLKEMYLGKTVRPNFYPDTPVAGGDVK